MYVAKNNKTLTLLFSIKKMVRPQGFEPQLAGYKPDALTIVLWAHVLVRREGLEPSKSLLTDGF